MFCEVGDALDMSNLRVWRDSGAKYLGLHSISVDVKGESDALLHIVQTKFDDCLLIVHPWNERFTGHPNGEERSHHAP